MRSRAKRSLGSRSVRTGARRTRLLTRLASRAHSHVGTAVLGSLSATAQLHPMSDPARHNVARVRNLPYRSPGAPEHHLDVYRPVGPTPEGGFPVVFYVHGGGFTMLSKDTHWVMGLAFARAGYLVFNISYRLAPRHPFPAAIEDTCAAYEWMLDNAHRWGGDVSRVVVAGESAGANLVSSLCIAACYERPEPWARRVFERAAVPVAAVPACGLFQVTDTERFVRKKKLPAVVRFVLLDITESYLRGIEPPRRGQCDLADPLLVFESGAQPSRPLPPFFLPVGTRDPILDDTRRMEAALTSLGVDARAVYYPGQEHAFHAFVWKQEARQLWRDSLGFLADLGIAGARELDPLASASV